MPSASRVPVEDDPASLQGRLAAHVDRPDEEEVFLAPRLSITPGGTHAEGVDHDIESPFAEPDRKRDPSSMLLAHSDKEDPTAASGEELAFDPVTARGAADEPPSRTPKKEKTSTRSPSSPIEPLLPRRSPAASDRPEPASNRRRISDISGEILPSINALVNDIEASRATPLVADSEGQAPAPSAFPSRRPDRSRPDAFALSEKPTIDRARPRDEKIPAGSPSPGRIERAGSAIRRGAATCLSGLGLAWRVYSRGCLWIQVRLSRLAGRLGAQGAVIASSLGSLLVRLGRHGLIALRVGVVHLGAGARFSARHAHRLSTNGLTAVGRMFAAALRTALPALASAFRSARSSLAEAASAAARGTTVAAAALGRGLVAIGRRWRGRGETVAGPDAGSPHRSLPTPSTEMATDLSLEGAIRPKTALALAAAFAAKHAGKPPPDKAVTAPGPVTPSPISRLMTAKSAAALRLALQPKGLALAGGTVAVSVVILLAVFSPDPTTTPFQAALTVPIPERQHAEAVASDSPALPSAGAPEAAARPLNDPIADMIAHVEKRRPSLPAEDNAGPILAGAETVDGLSAFRRAADVVGLGHLLKPGENYTVFVPNDAAFGQLPEDEVDRLFDPSGHERLLTLLSHHIVPERLTFDDIAGRVRAYTSLAGQEVTIDATEVIRINDAAMIEADLPLENGILHVIDQVLIVPEY